VGAYARNGNPRNHAFAPPTGADPREGDVPQDQIHVWVVRTLDPQIGNSVLLKSPVWMNHSGGLITRSWQMQLAVENGQLPTDLPDELTRLTLFRVRTQAMLKDEPLAAQGLTEGEVLVLCPSPEIAEYVAARPRDFPSVLPVEGTADQETLGRLVALGREEKKGSDKARVETRRHVSTQVVAILVGLLAAGAALAAAFIGLR
jgi:hypothetical protein